MGLLKNVPEYSLNGFDKKNIEACLEEVYTNQAQKHVRDLLLSTTVIVAGVSLKLNKEYIILDEIDMNGNFISREWVFPEYVYFKNE